MHSYKYLYGAHEIEPISTKAINDRLVVLNLRLGMELDVHYDTRDTQLVNALIKAIHFWSHINEKDYI